MKTRLPSLKLLTIAGLLAVLLAMLLADRPSQSAPLVEDDVQQPAPPPAALGSQPPVGAPDPSAGSGDQLVGEAARLLLQYGSLQARIRQRVSLFNQELVGNGTYYQRQDRQRTLLRMEMKLQVGHVVTSQLQVADGRFLWIRRSMPMEDLQMRVDLQRLAERRRQQIGAPPPVDSPPLPPTAGSTAAPAGGGPEPAAWMMGGLPNLLVVLQQRFQFEPPQRDRLGQLHVWRLEGQWRRAGLKELLPEAQRALADAEPIPWEALGPQLPTHVRLRLGADQHLPLFPYVVEFWRQTSVEDEPTRILSMEFHQVSNRVQLDPRLFTYEPTSEQAVIDITDRY